MRAYLITRKKFIGMTGAAALGVSLGSFQFFQHGKIQIKPITGEKYSPSFLRLCQNKKFRTVQDAMRSVKDRKISYELVYDGETV